MTTSIQCKWSCWKSHTKL